MEEKLVREVPSVRLLRPLPAVTAFVAARADRADGRHARARGLCGFREIGLQAHLLAIGAVGVRLIHTAPDGGVVASLVLEGCGLRCRKPVQWQGEPYGGCRVLFQELPRTGSRHAAFACAHRCDGQLSRWRRSLFFRQIVPSLRAVEEPSNDTVELRNASG